MATINIINEIKEYLINLVVLFKYIHKLNCIYSTLKLIEKFNFMYLKNISQFTLIL